MTYDWGNGSVENIRAGGHYSPFSAQKRPRTLPPGSAPLAAEQNALVFDGLSILTSSLSEVSHCLAPPRIDKVCVTVAAKEFLS